MSQRRLPAEIYWRRRLVLLAAVIALVWIALRVIGGGDDKPSAEPTPKRTPTTAATTVAPTSKVDGIVDVALTTGAKACDPEKIRITPTVRSDQLTKGPVTIGLVVSSTETAACTLEPDDADLLAVITANGTPVWDSTVCKDGLLADPVAISAGWSTVATVEWTGRGSGSKCSTKEGYATPGTYALQIGTLGGEPGKASFTLKARPAAPKPTKTTPTPKKTPKKTTAKGTTSTKTPSPSKTTKPAAD